MKVTNPHDVLVEVRAASVNPLDLEMSRGYGREVLSQLRALRRGQPCSTTSSPDLPLILGRDFSGVVLETGKDCAGFTPGDEVWGAVYPSSQGSFAQQVLASKFMVVGNLFAACAILNYLIFSAFSLLTNRRR